MKKNEAIADPRFPRLVIEDDPLTTYLQAIKRLDLAYGGDLRTLLRAIIREGERFARTPEGMHWKALLANSPIVRNGWLVWNVSGLEFLLKNDDADQPTPSELWHHITTQLAEMNVEPYLTRLMQDLRFHGNETSAENQDDGLTFYAADNSPRTTG